MNLSNFISRSYFRNFALNSLSSSSKFQNNFFKPGIFNLTLIKSCPVTLDHLRAYCRCLYVNLVRIMKFTQQTWNRTFKTMETKPKMTVLTQIFSLKIVFQPNLILQFPRTIYLPVINFCHS